MRGFVLRSKHWLLFLLLGLPSVLFFGLMLTISVAFILEEVVFYMKWVNVVMDLRIFSLLLFTTWGWSFYMRSLRRLFSNSLSSSLKEKFYCGHWGLSFPFLSFSLFRWFLCLMLFLSKILILGVLLWFAFMFLGSRLHFYLHSYSFSMLSIDWQNWWTWRNCKEIPKSKEYIGDFFRFLFFPIGVWSLQPRVNRLFEQCKTDSKVDFGSPRYREVWLLLRYPCLAILTLLGFLVLMNLVLLICVK